ncbi:MAG: transporter ATP-binding protein [Clostridia bacterium]|jgi:putative ABC transport system ATP-binding protein|nr:transporter ATP-binding protein [Clostridia bacterium]
MFFIKNVRYKSILDIENLIIPDHKITCIVGESGSGKTTLLKLFNKMISSDGGEILYNEQSLANINAITLRRKVVMLSQNPSIFKGSIRDNLLIGLKFAEKSLAADDKLYEILKMVHLNKGLDEDTENMSGGEKQRLALGRVLLLDPECFLLDEPSSALDEDTEHLIIEKIVQYSKANNKTLIMVTHSKKAADTFADYIVEMRNGRVISQREV